jgi:hypothetical protein
MTISEYDWKRLQGLGFDLNFVENTAKGAKGSKVASSGKSPGGQNPDLMPMDKMAIAHGLEKEPATGPSTFIMGEGGDDADFEPDGGMLITQLKSMQDNVATSLKMISPDSNLDPWIASKISEASHGLNAIADYLKYGEKE